MNENTPNPDFVPAKFELQGIVSGESALLDMIRSHILRFPKLRIDVEQSPGTGFDHYKYRIREK